MKYLILLFVFASLSFPQLSFALEAPDDLVACKDGGACNFCQLVQTVDNATDWVVALALIIAVIILIYAGYKITASRGDVGMVTDGRKLVGNVALGVFITILAWTLIDVLLKTTTGGGFGVWNKPAECGRSFGVRGAADVDANLKNNKGITVTKDSTNGTGAGPGGDGSGNGYGGGSDGGGTSASDYTNIGTDVSGNNNGTGAGPGGDGSGNGYGGGNDTGGDRTPFYDYSNPGPQ